MFLRAGCVPEPGWIAASERFMQKRGPRRRRRPRRRVPPAGVADLMRPGWGELFDVLRVAFGGGQGPSRAC